MVGKRAIAVVAAALSDDARTAIRRAREAGFAGILFDARSPSLHLPDLSSTGRREFARLVAAEGLQLVALRARVDAPGLAPGGQIDRVLAGLSRILETARDLRAGCACVDLHQIPGRADLARRDFSAALAELGQAADRYSKVVALCASSSTLAALHESLVEMACPWFGIDLDAVSVVSDASLSGEMSRISEMIRHVRARDAIVGPDQRVRPMPLGQGSVNWGRLLRGLDEADFRGALTIDPAGLPDPASSAKSARILLEKLQNNP